MLAKFVGSVALRWIEPDENTLTLRWSVDRADALSIPPLAETERADDLWQTTCFELFLKDREGAGYTEFNFSPSGRWAAYRFDSYREGMAEAEVHEAPRIAVESEEGIFVLTVTLGSAILAGAESAGLSAVIEEADGTKSYWALAHPPGKPDFHDPACFALPLAAPQRP